jgi:hypothetical protein
MSSTIFFATDIACYHRDFERRGIGPRPRRAPGTRHLRSSAARLRRRFNRMLHFLEMRSPAWAAAGNEVNDLPAEPRVSSTIKPRGGDGRSR